MNKFYIVIFLSLSYVNLNANVLISASNNKNYILREINGDAFVEDKIICTKKFSCLISSYKRLA